MFAVERLICLLTGYVFGCFLTGELVARRRTGAGAGRLGTGNPGMANLAHELGLGWGLLVLLGDVLKTALASPNPAFIDVRVEREENVYPMVPAGAALDEMLLI